MPHDYRLNPFSGMMESVAMTDYHIVPANQPHYIRLRDVPAEDNPSTVRARFFAFIVGNLTAAQTSITMDFDLATPFSVGDVLTIDDEQVEVTGISGGTVTVTRGVNGTLAVIHTAESTTSPLRAYGGELAPVAAEPATNQFQADYTTAPSGDDTWNTGTIRFNSADANKMVQVRYNGTGSISSGERAGNDPLRNYGYAPETDIIAILSGTVNLPIYNECQIFYVREGATANRAAFPGIAVRATGAAVVYGTVNAGSIVGASTAGYGAGGGGNGAGNSVVYSNFRNLPLIARATPSLDQQDLFLNDTGLPLFWGSGGTPGYIAQGATNNGAGGAGGGGIVIFSPYQSHIGQFNASGANGGNVSGNNARGGGGGAGGVVVLVGETMINEATFNINGGNGGTVGSTAGQTPGNAGPAGWVRVIEFGGRS